jgi:hypothetical protein
MPRRNVRGQGGYFRDSLIISALDLAAAAIVIGNK